VLAITTEAPLITVHRNSGMAYNQDGSCTSVEVYIEAIGSIALSSIQDHSSDDGQYQKTGLDEVN
jgi:hypothetical protein